MNYTDDELLFLLETGTLNWGNLINENFSILDKYRTIRLKAGETLNAKIPVYISSDGKAYKANSKDSSKCPAIGVVKDEKEIAQDTFDQIILIGTLKVSSASFSPGSIYYLGEGELVTEPPSGGVIQVMGVERSDTELLVIPLGTSEVSESLADYWINFKIPFIQSAFDPSSVFLESTDRIHAELKINTSGNASETSNHTLIQTWKSQEDCFYFDGENMLAWPLEEVSISYAEMTCCFRIRNLVRKTTYYAFFRSYNPVKGAMGIGEAKTFLVA